MDLKVRSQSLEGHFFDWLQVAHFMISVCSTKTRRLSVLTPSSWNNCGLWNRYGTLSWLCRRGCFWQKTQEQSHDFFFICCSTKPTCRVCRWSFFVPCHLATKYGEGYHQIQQSGLCLSQSSSLSTFFLSVPKILNSPKRTWWNSAHFKFGDNMDQSRSQDLSLCECSQALATDPSIHSCCRAWNRALFFIPCVRYSRDKHGKSCVQCQHWTMLSLTHYWTSLRAFLSPLMNILPFVRQVVKGNFWPLASLSVHIWCGISEHWDRKTGMVSGTKFQ